MDQINQPINEGNTVQTWALKLIRAVEVLEGGVAGGGGMLTVQHLSSLGPQGAIVRKGAGRPPVVTGRGIETIIGEPWEIQYRGEEGGTPSLWKTFAQQCHYFCMALVWCTEFVSGMALLPWIAFWFSLPSSPCCQQLCQW